MNFEEKIIILEDEVKKLKNKRKDSWDVLQILGGLLIPAAIAYAGWQYSVAMNDAEIQSSIKIAKLQIESSEQKAEFEQRISETNARVSQAGLVASFLKSLLSKEEAEQKLAIKAVLIALPAEGPRLVKLLKESDEKEDVKKFASVSLSNYRNTLVSQFFSTEKSERSEAYARLQSSFQNDSSIIPELIAGGRQNPDNLNAVFNLLVFLSHMNMDTLKPYVNEIVEYSREVEGNGDKTKERAEKLRSRLPSS
jgi:hypothetical protein